MQEDSQCFIINGPAFAQLSERSSQVKIFALETAVNRFSDVMWVMQQILFMSMDKRLAIFLSDEIARTGLNSVHLTHEQIARYIGSAREVVSRMLKYFASEGIVEISRKGIRILNKPKLYALARYSGGNKKSKAAAPTKGISQHILFQKSYLSSGRAALYYLDV